jgi:transposase-like protein
VDLGISPKLRARRILAMAMFDPQYFCIKEELVPLLEDYQIERINDLVSDFIRTNSEFDTHVIEFCPKCGASHPKLIKGGKAGSGKQMLQCVNCRGRFVYDTGSLTFYSHQPLSKWTRFIEMTIDKATLCACAAELRIHKTTAFRMRQKLMAFIRTIQQDNTISGLCELDETYIHADRKGLIPTEIGDDYYTIFCLSALMKTIADLYGDRAAGNCALLIDTLTTNIKVAVKRGWKEKRKNRKRGISKDLVCIFTGIERQGNCISHVSNLGKPAQADVNDFVGHVESGSHVWVDGMQTYVPALENNGCTYKVCPTQKGYTAVDHLNNINAMHENFKDWIRKFRGVSAIYADRYAALVSYIYDHRSMSVKELRSALFRDLNRHQVYFFQKDITKKELFIADEDQRKRNGLTSMVEQYRRSKEDPMSIEMAMSMIGVY